MMTTRLVLGRTTARALACLPLLLGLAVGASATPVAAVSDETDTDFGRILLVLDSSGSMAEPAPGGTTKMAAAKDALGQVVRALPEEAYVGLRVYGATVFSKSEPGACQDSQLTVETGTDNRDLLASAVADAEPYGETPIGYSLRKAAADLGSEGARSIVLVSDGIATCDPDPCQVAAELAEAGIDLQINVVGLDVDADARSQLRCIAAAGNGAYYDAGSADEIVESLESASDRALRPFELEGTPIEGGPSSIEATPVTAGQWVDTLGEDGTAAGERWFEFDRAIADSTVQVGVTTLGAKGASTDVIEVKVTTEDGASCGVANDLKQLNSGQLLGAGVLTGVDTNADSDECRGERLLIVVSRDHLGDGSAPFGLKIVEEPPATNVESLPEALPNYDADYVAPEVSGSVTNVVGGSSFGDAVELTDGVYSGTIVPGETQVFKVQVEYGQSLAARLLTLSASPDLQEALGSSGPFADLQIFNPMRMAVDYAQGSEPAGQAATEIPGSLTFATTEVRYRNRALSSELASMDGSYYLVYGVARDPDGDSYEMPYELQVGVQGSAGGAPTYAGGQTIQGTETPEPEPSSPGNKPEAEAPRGDGGMSTPVKVAAVGGLGAVAACCLAAAMVLMRRTRT